MGFKSSVVDPVGSSSVCRIRLFSLNILLDPVVFTQTFCWILSDPHHFAIMEFKKNQFLTLLHETALETWKSIRVREFTGWVRGDRKKSWDGIKRAGSGSVYQQDPGPQHCKRGGSHCGTALKAV